MQWNNSGNSTFEQPPVGAHAAICIKVVDIGTQKGEYKGEPTSRRQNIITWELPLETREDGKPFIISKFYTASLGEKANLYKDLTNWFGKPPQAPFDPKTLIGKPCQVIVSAREGSDKKVVSGLAGVPKGVTIPKEPQNPTVFFSLEDFNQEVFDGLSEGIKSMIMKSPEYAEIMNGGPHVEDEEKEPDEIPF